MHASYMNGINGGMIATPQTLAAAGIGRDVIRPETVASVSYQRTREMTIDELLLENRVVFLIGEINHASAAHLDPRTLRSLREIGGGRTTNPRPSSRYVAYPSRSKSTTSISIRFR